MGTSTILRTANKQRLSTLSVKTVSLSTDFVDTVTGIVPNTVSLCLFAVRSMVEVGNNTHLPIPSIFSMSIPEQSTPAPVSATAMVYLAGNRVWLLMVFVSSSGILCSLWSVLQCVGSNFTRMSMLQALQREPGGCAGGESATLPLAPPLLEPG